MPSVEHFAVQHCFSGEDPPIAAQDLCGTWSGSTFFLCSLMALFEPGPLWSTKRFNIHSVKFGVRLAGLHERVGRAQRSANEFAAEFEASQPQRFTGAVSHHLCGDFVV